jgi:hypothetical protein
MVALGREQEIPADDEGQVPHCTTTGLGTAPSVKRRSLDTELIYTTLDPTTSVTSQPFARGVLRVPVSQGNLSNRTHNIYITLDAHAH